VARSHSAAGYCTTCTDISRVTILATCQSVPDETHRTSTTRTFGLHRPSRGTRKRQFLRRNPVGITALLVSVVLASSVTITMNAELLADLHSLPTHAKTHLGLLARRAGWTSVIGFILAILQFITGVANLQSANAFSLTIAALAGVGAWPHAIEAHCTGRRSVRRPTRRPMTRGRGATPRSMVQLNRRTSHGPTRTAGQRFARER
jgi:hypothetical protein